MGQMPFVSDENNSDNDDLIDIFDDNIPKTNNPYNEFPGCRIIGSQSNDKIERE